MSPRCGDTPDEGTADDLQEPGSHEPDRRMHHARLRKQHPSMALPTLDLELAPPLRGVRRALLADRKLLPEAQKIGRLIVAEEERQ